MLVQWLVLAVAPAFASSIVSSLDGNTYSLWEVGNIPGVSYTLEVDVQVTNGYSGGLTDFLDALSIMLDNDVWFTGASLVAHPSGAWALQSGGLNAGGCDGAGRPFICAQATGLGAPLFTGTAPNLLAFQFLVYSRTVPQDGDTAHVKYHYVNSAGVKVGDLSSSLVIQCVDSSCGGAQTTPEPNTLLLSGLGLLAACFLRGRRIISRLSAPRTPARRIDPQSCPELEPSNRNPP